MGDADNPDYEVSKDPKDLADYIAGILRDREVEGVVVEEKSIGYAVRYQGKTVRVSLCTEGLRVNGLEDDLWVPVTDGLVSFKGINEIITAGLKVPKKQ